MGEEGIKRKIIIDPKSTCMDCWVFLLSQSPRRRADVNTTNHSQIRFSQSMVRERIQRGNYWDNKGKVSIAQRHNRQSICIPKEGRRKHDKSFTDQILTFDGKEKDSERKLLG